MGTEKSRISCVVAMAPSLAFSGGCILVVADIDWQYSYVKRNRNYVAVMLRSIAATFLGRIVDWFARPIDTFQTPCYHFGHSVFYFTKRGAAWIRDSVLIAV